MKLGFTGTRRGMTPAQVAFLEWYFETYNVTEFHHGDCVGADAEAHEIADKVYGCKIVIHPPINETNRAFCVGDVLLPAEHYMTRNQDIVRDTNELVAMPATNQEVQRSGTWSTVRYARKGNKPVHVVGPS